MYYFNIKFKNLVKPLILTIFILQSCDSKFQKTVETKKQKTLNSYHSSSPKSNEYIEPKKISLGEDSEDINAYAKNIYEKNGIIYIDLDFVEIKYRNIDEKFIVNKSSKIRTYIIDAHTLVISNDCEKLVPLDILKYKESLLKDKTAVTIGESKNGRMISVNFGCYG
ncbi:hypothetical protein JSO61_001510 [Riemerella anatipestifer]|uniref:hypothetical protein n=1 Tax=Riemerella anatipestifer TaxID=34085 RepID=UPI0030C0144F